MNAWKIGQTVGIGLHNNGQVFRGTVKSMTSARVTVEFHRPDGGIFRRAYAMNGRAVPYHQGAQSLTRWTPEHEAAWTKRIANHVATLKRVQAAKVERLAVWEADSDALAYALDLLAKANDPRRERAIALINRWLAEQAPAKESTNG